MRNFTEFLRDFYNNHGLPVLVAVFVGKITAFLMSLLLVRNLTVSEFGQYSVVPAVFILFATFTGFGLPMGLLRYGSVLKSGREKYELARQLFLPGLIFQLLLSFLFLFSSLWFSHYKGVFSIFLAFSIRFIGFYFVSFLQAFLRIHLQNRRFAFITSFWNLTEFIFAASVLYFYGLQGFLFVFALAPFIVLIFYRRQWFSIKVPNFTKLKSVLNYSFHASFTNLLGEFLFTLDILMLGFLLTDNAVAEYKVAILIPSNVAFLGAAFLQADFPIIASRYKNLQFIKNYLLNYFRLFFPLAFFVLTISYVFNEKIVSWLFGEKYLHMKEEFFILMCIFVFGMLTRTLFGNFFAAVGKTIYNSWLSLISVIVLIFFGLVLVPSFGLFGMFWALGSAFLLYALGSIFLFRRYLQSIR